MPRNGPQERNSYAVNGFLFSLLQYAESTVAPEGRPLLPYPLVPFKTDTTILLGSLFPYYNIECRLTKGPIGWVAVEDMAEPKADRHVFSFSSCAVIVAHPDDETLWAAGVMMMYPQTQWTVISLCRADDPDRSPKFFRALKLLNAAGAMGNLDDGPEQSPLASQDVQDMILRLLPSHRFDLIISHGLRGEYTRHLRHEETAKAVMTLWESERLLAKEVWMFAYEDGGGEYLPRPAKDAQIRIRLPENIWQKKLYIITEIYGFGAESFEARVTQREEAFRSLPGK